MSTWVEKQEAIRTAIALAARMPDQATIGGTQYNRRVEWANRYSAARWDNGTAFGDLVLMGVTGKGQDETRYTFTAGVTPALSTNIPTYGGYRLLTVQVRIGMDSQEPGEESVGFRSGTMRTRLRRDDVLGILQTYDVALVRIGQTVEADYEDQGRMLSLGVTEIVFATTEEDTDAEDTGDYVASVAGDGDPEIDSVVLNVTT